jgi:hypothetical protein
MRVFAFCATTPAQRLRDAGAHAVFAEMRELPGLLQPAGAPDAADPARP